MIVRIPDQTLRVKLYPNKTIHIKTSKPVADQEAKFVEKTVYIPGVNAPVDLTSKLSSAGQSVIAAGEAFTPDEAPTHIMSITGFVNGRGLSYDGTDATRIITQDLYNLPAANYLTLSGTKPAGKSLKFEFNYYTYTNSYVSYYIDIPEGTMEYSMSAIQNWWAGYQLSKFKLIVGYTDNSNISPSDVNIQISYKGY